MKKASTRVQAHDAKAFDVNVTKIFLNSVKLSTNTYIKLSLATYVQSNFLSKATKSEMIGTFPSLDSPNFQSWGGDSISPFPSHL